MQVTDLYCYLRCYSSKGAFHTFCLWKSATWFFHKSSIWCKWVKEASSTNIVHQNLANKTNKQCWCKEKWNTQCDWTKSKYGVIYTIKNDLGRNQAEISRNSWLKHRNEFIVSSGETILKCKTNRLRLVYLDWNAATEITIPIHMRSHCTRSDESTTH